MITQCWRRLTNCNHVAQHGNEDSHVNVPLDDPTYGGGSSASSPLVTHESVGYACNPRKRGIATTIADMKLGSSVYY